MFDQRGPTVRHENHFHVGLNQDGAEQRTSFWTRGYWPPDLLAIKSDVTRSEARVLDGGTTYRSLLSRQSISLSGGSGPACTVLYGDYDNDWVAIRHAARGSPGPRLLRRESLQVEAAGRQYRTCRSLCRAVCVRTWRLRPRRPPRHLRDENRGTGYFYPRSWFRSCCCLVRDVRPALLVDDVPHRLGRDLL